MNNDHEYWKGRWKRRETGWHQNKAEPRLIENFATLAPTRVFVPLCGKSLDLKWLLDQGHEVIGAELSELACTEFFQDHAIPFKKTQEGSFTVFRGEKICIWNGDFFQLDAAKLGKIGAVYDRAALIALPPSIRTQYAQHMLGLLGPSTRSGQVKYLQILLERVPQDEQGPPFSVTREELAQLYGSQWTITPLSREKTDPKPGSTADAWECVYDLRFKSE